jgi:hypothetical protein
MPNHIQNLFGDFLKTTIYRNSDFERAYMSGAMPYSSSTKNYMLFSNEKRCKYNNLKIDIKMDYLKYKI